MKVIAIIPARSGSKGVIDKNIRKLNGKPLIAYSIEHALAAKTVERVLVSTDSPQYAEIAKTYGAEVPFIRPPEISGDNSLDLEVFEHALMWLNDNEKYVPDICVHLRPTHPVRNARDIDRMVTLLADHPDWDSVRSIKKAPVTPYKMWLKDERNILSPVATCGISEAYNAPRQSLPAAYLQNACIDVVRESVIRKNHSMTGNVIGGFVQALDFDIDTETDLIRAEHYLEISEKLLNGEQLTVCFDIDGLVALKNAENDYSKSMPNFYCISVVNKLYDMGHSIIFNTARGSKTGIDWNEITHRQLEEWGVKFNKLQFGKPHADIYLDDRYVDIGQILNLLEGEK